MFYNLTTLCLKRYISYKIFVFFSLKGDEKSDVYSDSDDHEFESNTNSRNLGTTNSDENLFDRDGTTGLKRTVAMRNLGSTTESLNKWSN